MLTALREKLASHTGGAISAFIVGTADAHQSEYVSANDKRREALSGFTGSAGTAVVTANKALLWTDGRYYLQAGQQLSDEWTLMRSGEKDVPTVEKWLSKELGKGARVGIDPYLESVNSFRRLEVALKPVGVTMECISPNPVDDLWQEQPPVPCTPITVHEMKYSGCTSSDKISKLRSELPATGCSAVLVTALDDIAWLFNIRGQDISYNPVTMAYALVTGTDVTLFVDASKVSDEVRTHLGTEVKIRPYEDACEAVRALGAELLAGSTTAEEGAAGSGNNRILVDPASCNQALYQAIPTGLAVEKQSLVAAAKAIKNEVEIEGMRQAHIRDGAALVTFLAWLEAELEKGSAINEVSAADKLEQCRAAQDKFVSLSFDTISSSGPNGAVIHYKPELETCRAVVREEMYLVDSGGQYLDGTTDITRTLHFGRPTPFQREAFTRTLQGHIALARAVFPEGTTGSRIDSFAREALWRAGLDYRHGTGHGVGAYLNVHEGPQGVGFRPRVNEAGFAAGMTISDEPGYYHDGEFGVRIESVLVSREAKTRHNFGGSRFLEFENITWAPIQLKLIDASLLTPVEVQWVDEYHMGCREKLTPLLKEGSFEHQWLMKETVPVADYQSDTAC